MARRERFRVGYGVWVWRNMLAGAALWIVLGLAWAAWKVFSWAWRVGR